MTGLASTINAQPNLTGGNLTGGNLTGGNLTGGNLTGGNLTGRRHEYAICRYYGRWWRW
jgi:uncharacterized protein YjbI with pentapeptide repeats